LFDAKQKIMIYVHAKKARGRAWGGFERRYAPVGMIDSSVER
jgi:hypothetical protein